MSVETPIIEEKSKIKHKEIAELEEPMLKIFQEILPHLEKGEYDLIIGIDASGRIPTLIINKLVNHVYAKESKDLPKTRFLAGRAEKEEINLEIQKWNPQKKVLIIEDAVASGSSIKNLMSALKDNGIHFDVIAVSENLIGYFIEQRSRLGFDNLYTGTWEVLDISGHKGLSGVKKEMGDTFAHSYKNLLKNEVGNVSPNVQETINEAREDVDIVANSLIGWYESQKHEK